MGKKALTTGGIFVLIAVAFVVGRTFGAHATWQSYIQTRIQREEQLQHQMLELDRSFLANLVARPNTLVSGTYTLEVQYAGKSSNSYPATLVFNEGKLASITVPTRVVNEYAQVGNVVSWTLDWIDGDQGPSANFIGVIDGNQMLGKVYLEPGRGWHEGEPAAYGVWRLKQASAATVPAKPE